MVRRYNERRVWLPPESAARLVLNLGSILRAHSRERARGRVFTARLDVLFSNIDVVEPDVLFVTKTREAEVPTEAHLFARPTSWSRSAQRALAAGTSAPSRHWTNGFRCPNTGSSIRISAPLIPEFI